MTGEGLPIKAAIPRNMTMKSIALKTILWGSCLIWLGLSACAAPKFIPQDLQHLKDPEDLGLAAQEAYQKARAQSEKKEKLKWTHAGIVYSEKCLKTEAEKPICLYYNVLNRGYYIKNHIPNYQKALKLMITHCETLIDVDPGYQQAGCYRILGSIYAKAPSFSFNPKNITRDLDKSLEYLEAAVRLAPDYALNHLVLAKTLLALDENEEAKQQLKDFDRLRSSNLDKDYPEWKKEREELARKLH